MGLNLEEQKAVDRFRQDVVEPSMSKLVVLDFWAEWCGPCKALAPMLEKVADEYADKGVVLKKVNVDEEQFIASQFQVQSIPTVYAMFQGRPVADLTSARSESQLKQALDQILAQLPLDPNAAGGESGQNDGMPDVEQLIAMGEQLLEAGENEKAQGGDMDARYAYAEAAFAARQRDAAADELLGMVETDREWNEGAARTKLLQIFEAVGLEDPWVVATRRRLSKILFG